MEFCTKEGCDKIIYAKGLCRKHYYDTPEWRQRIREYKRKWKRNNPDYDKEFYQRVRTTPEHREKQKKYRQDHRDENIVYQKEYHRKGRMLLKITVIGHYSNGEFKCACCGEDKIEFLSIDHINGGGNKHRKEINRKSGRWFYKWLCENNLPEGYRVLCHNCNMCIGMYGYCAHNETVSYREKFNNIYNTDSKENT